MQLAFIHARTPNAVDASLCAVVAAMSREARRVIGVVQEPVGAEGRHRCDMDLIEIASGTRRPVSQALGAGSTGCRLDPDAIETAAARVALALGPSGADLVVVNRFGKLEAEGRGFRPVIAEALLLGIPVLVGVNDLNRAAFDAFAGGLAVELPDAVGPVLDWCLARKRQQAA